MALQRKAVAVSKKIHKVLDDVLKFERRRGVSIKAGDRCTCPDIVVKVVLTDDKYADCQTYLTTAVLLDQTRQILREVTVRLGIWLQPGRLPYSADKQALMRLANTRMEPLARQLLDLAANNDLFNMDLETKYNLLDSGMPVHVAGRLLVEQSPTLPDTAALLKRLFPEKHPRSVEPVEPGKKHLHRKMEKLLK